MKSKTLNAKSDEAQGERATDSVYDFLYHDGRRIASFLAQFDPSGALTQINRGTAAEKARHDGHKLEGGAGFPGIAKGMASNTGEVRYRRQDEILRVYDPTWANAREFLDVVDDAGLIHRDVSSAALGQIVLCQGSLTVKNLQMLMSIWASPAAKKMMGDGLKQNAPKPLPKSHRNDTRLTALHAAARAEAEALKDGMAFFMDIIPTLPHTVQATISGDDSVWCSLMPEGLTFDPTDISLKFSDRIPGEWSAIGILDALPDEPPSAEIKKVDYLSGAAMAKLGDAITPMIRTFLGRPYEAYGITPLLVFREVTGR